LDQIIAMNNARQIRNLALVGFMGTGKSTVGRIVARVLRFDFVDTDELIEDRLHQSIPEVFAQKGESWFREYERGLVAELAQYENTVFATGGGLVVCAANLASLKKHALVVCLWASPETIWARVRRHAHRPLLQGPNPQMTIRQLLTERLPCYRQADVLISTGLRSPKQVALQVLHQFQQIRTQAISHEGNDPPIRP
jgi:shikimate kinase